MINNEPEKRTETESKCSEPHSTNNNSYLTNLNQQCEESCNSFLSTAHNDSIKNLNIDEKELIEIQFTKCIRELFLQRFVKMFVSYEKFVIVPNIETKNIESWWTCREYTGNFDSKMFLIEQPSPWLPFLSHFIATQMFASFIDLKIISLIDNQKSIEPNVKVRNTKCKRLKINE